MKITFLLAWAYGMGGLVRTTVNTANHFSDLGHDVTLISFFRHTERPWFDIRPEVELRSLLDIRADATFGRFETWQRDRESRFIPHEEKYHDRITLRGDYLLWRALRSLDADVLVTTRPAFNLAAAMWAPRHTLTIGQDHLNYTRHDDELRWYMKQWYPRLDAMVALTDADRRDYRKLLKGTPTTVRAIGNAVTAGPHPQTTQDEPVIIASGRYTGQKRFHHLIQAFATVHHARPEWRLRIFGHGPSQENLQALIERLGLRDHVTLMGRTSDMEGEFAKASIMAMSSRYEGFPMVILEAFGCGLPVVSYDCPRGPAEMITSGQDGILVRNGSPKALAAALLRLVDDPQLRRTMSGNALQTAQRHSIDKVGAQWEDLFGELRAERGKRPKRPLKRVLRREARATMERRRQLRAERAD